MSPFKLLQVQALNNIFFSLHILFVDIVTGVSDFLQQVKMTGHYQYISLNCLLPLHKKGARCKFPKTSGFVLRRTWQVSHPPPSPHHKNKKRVKCQISKQGYWIRIATVAQYFLEKVFLICQANRTLLYFIGQYCYFVTSWPSRQDSLKNCWEGSVLTQSFKINFNTSKEGDGDIPSDGWSE